MVTGPTSLGVQSKLHLVRPSARRQVTPSTEISTAATLAPLAVPAIDVGAQISTFAPVAGDRINDVGRPAQEAIAIHNVATPTRPIRILDPKLLGSEGLNEGERAQSSEYTSG